MFEPKAIESLKRFIKHVLIFDMEPEDASDWERGAEIQLHLSHNDTRIVEFGYFVNTGGRTGYGGSWMRVEVEAQGAILAAEDFLLSWGEKKVEIEKDVDGTPIYDDWHGECMWRLAYHIGADFSAPVWNRMNESYDRGY